MRKTRGETWDRDPRWQLVYAPEQKDEACVRCGGRGKLTTPYRKISRRTLVNWIACPECEGSGKALPEKKEQE